MNYLDFRNYPIDLFFFFFFFLEKDLFLIIMEDLKRKKNLVSTQTIKKSD